MVDNKKDKIQAREKYEPMEIEVVKVTPQGILCQSGGAQVTGGLTKFTRF